MRTEMTISRAITDSDYRNPPSKWNYAVPIIGIAAWTAAALTGITYGFMKVHDYAHPSDQYNPDIYDKAIKCLKALGYIGAATLPLSLGATVARATYNGCATAGQGMCRASGRFFEVIKESVHPKQLGERPGIIVNTVAAVVAGPVIAIWSLAQASRDY